MAKRNTPVAGNGSHFDLRTELRTLPVRLTDDERLEFGTRAAKVHDDLADKGARLKSVQDEIKGEIKELAAEESRLLRCIGSGVEWREVECKQIADYALGLMRWIRTDTGEEIDSRPLTNAEKQRRLEFDVDARAETTKARFEGIADDAASEDADGETPEGGTA